MSSAPVSPSAPTSSHGGKCVAPAAEVTCSSYTYCTDCTKTPASVSPVPSVERDASTTVPSSIAPMRLESATSTSAAAAQKTPTHIDGLSSSWRTKWRSSAVKTMPPPRSSTHTDALSVISPATISTVAASWKSEGTTSSEYVGHVMYASSASIRSSSASPAATHLRRHAEAACAGSASDMPTKSTHVGKSAGVKGASSPVIARARRSYSALRQSVQPAAAARPTAKMSTRTARGPPRPRDIVDARGATRGASGACVELASTFPRHTLTHARTHTHTRAR